MTLEPIRYHSEQGWIAGAIVARGRALLQCVFVEGSGLSITKLPLADERFMQPLEYRGQPYPENRARRHLRRMGRKFGITKAAKAALKEIS